MCGVAGFLDPSNQTPDPLHTLRSMGAAIAHRGPDGSGEWFDARSGVGLAHLRLSVIDLSAAGAQPMKSSCGRFSISFNGELYNFEALRRELELTGDAPPWRGHSDTEVLLACISAWGVDRTLRKGNGMFAFALWDAQSQELILARDRFGEKPLYFGYFRGALIFASELKAFRHYPGFHGQIDPNALGMLMQFNYIPAPFSIWKNVQKLLPGVWKRFQARNGVVSEVGSGEVYWSALDCARDCASRREVLSDAEAVGMVEASLFEAVRIRMRADVALGAFLSGGIDSSVVAAAMQSQSFVPVKTFSIACGDPLYNEGEYARAVANHLGTDHNELYVESEKVRDVIPRLPVVYDEPFADVSQIPTFLVSQMARAEVVVALSGDGGDELFGGYHRHFWGPRLWRRLRHFPKWSRAIGSGLLGAIPPAAWNSALGLVRGVVPVNAPGSKLHKLSGVLGSEDFPHFYQGLISFWKNPAKVVPNYNHSAVLAFDAIVRAREFDYSDAMMVLDAASYLPGDILTKVDRASMAVGLEVRVPFLDINLFELAWQLPRPMRIRGGVGKWVLREVLSRYVPDGLIDRPKMGFGIPIGAWLRRELRDWAEDLLSESALSATGMLNPAPIRKIWSMHLKGGADYEHHLWSILMFQSWVRQGQGQ